VTDRKRTERQVLQPNIEHARPKNKETLDALSNIGFISQIVESQAIYKTNRKELSFKNVFCEPLTPVKKRRAPRSLCARTSL